jgi:hypothetical protein
MRPKRAPVIDYDAAPQRVSRLALIYLQALASPSALLSAKKLARFSNEAGLADIDLVKAVCWVAKRYTSAAEQAGESRPWPC